MKRKSSKRRRGGRNRKLGPRYQDGQLCKAAERGWANMQPVLEARCKARGLRPSEDSLRAMRDPLEGYSLGKMKNDGTITESQHDAGQKYWHAYYNWARTSGMPRITAKAGSYGLTSPGRSEAPDEVAETAQRTYYAAADALISAGMIAEWECRRVCLEDEDVRNRGALFNGLDSLLAHFK